MIALAPFGFYLGALVLFLLGLGILQATSRFTRSGGAEYEARGRRRVAGIVLIMAAVASALTGATQSFSRSKLPAIDPKIANPVSAISGPAVAPIALAPNVVQAGVLAPAKPSLPQASLDLPLQKATEHLAHSQYDQALDEVNASLRADPQNPAAFALRGDIYAARNQWPQAEQDYQTVIQLDGQSTQAKFNLAQIEFAQKKYDDARQGFALLEQDPDMGDLAKYKVFLCDLLSARVDIAGKEFDAFNKAGKNASFYFANVAWSLYHHNRDEARNWLMAAGYIFPPPKFKLYADNLSAIGHPATAQSTAGQH